MLQLRSVCRCFYFLFTFRSLYDQLKENQKREEDELAERRKLMYGVRPMDDEEYKDYEQMEAARRFREKQNRERIDRETRTFRSFLIVF